MSSSSQKQGAQNKVKLPPEKKKLLVRVLVCLLKALLDFLGQNSDSSRPCPTSSQDNPADGQVGGRQAL